MLTEKQMKEVKEEYLRIIRSVKRPDCDIEGFISYLESTDFFTAPASTKYHSSFPGGLCLHSINVYKSLLHITNSFAKKTVKNPNYVEITQEEAQNQDSVVAEPEFIKVPIYSRDTIILVGLLHDLSKINFYEMIVKNVKDYCEDGDKKDANGTFKWKQYKEYAVKDASQREIGNKGINSYLKASMYFPLTIEETNTLIYQYSATATDNPMDLSNILARNNLAVYLHAADTIATYCIEK